ncbi:hypothetical protein B0H14DRAFT_2590843 [Mycena olivaceomarginata]|nr:hypothetical protein B0H14DRAFT_2590843 [Mycena olivaceomarginata]
MYRGCGCCQKAREPDPRHEAGPARDMHKWVAESTLGPHQSYNPPPLSFDGQVPQISNLVLSFDGQVPQILFGAYQTSIALLKPLKSSPTRLFEGKVLPKRRRGYIRASKGKSFGIRSLGQAPCLRNVYVNANAPCGLIRTKFLMLNGRLIKLSYGPPKASLPRRPLRMRCSQNLIALQTTRLVLSDDPDSTSDDFQPIDVDSEALLTDMQESLRRLPQKPRKTQVAPAKCNPRSE